MPRVAGSSPYYEVGVIDATGHVKGRPIRLPSVTTILKALPKGGMEWWGYKMGLTEARRLAQTQAAPVFDESFNDDAFYDMVKQMGRNGDAVTPSNALSSAGARGTNVHDMAEKLFTEGTMPPKADIPEEQLGYAQALWAFYNDKAKGREIVLQEEPVFSLEHRYAGTLDLLLRVPDGPYVLIDFKTSKAIYESHLLQLVAYEYAARELGFVPEDAVVISCVVRLGADGAYEIKNSSCSIDDFLLVKQMWQMLEDMKGGAKWQKT